MPTYYLLYSTDLLCVILASWFAYILKKAQGCFALGAIMSGGEFPLFDQVIRLGFLYCELKETV